MTQNANHLAAINAYGHQAKESIQALRDLLPGRHDRIDDYVRQCDELIATADRRDQKRNDTSHAYNALLSIESHINLDAVGRLRAAAENPRLNLPLDSLYSLVKSMANAEDMQVVERFFIAALISGHAATAHIEAARRTAEIQVSLSSDLVDIG